MTSRLRKIMERGPRKFLRAELSTQEMRLKQMGAKIEVINSFLCYIRFEVNDMKVKYVYNLNRKGQYFLERVSPYPLPVGTFESEKDVVESIRTDIDQIQQLGNSSHFEELLEMNADLRYLSRRLDSICLYYDIKQDDIDLLKVKLDDMHSTLDEIRDHSERVYFKTDPFCVKKDHNEKKEDV